MQSMPKHSSLRAVERRAYEVIIEIAGAEQWKPGTRIGALMRLSALIDGCALELDAQRPKPPKDPDKFEPVYI
jgi:hypothetical protein